MIFSVTAAARAMITAAIVGVPLLAWAQGTASTEKNLREKEKQVEANRAKTAADRERINARLVETGKVIQLTEQRLTHIESNLDGLAAKENQLRGTLEQRYGTISALLAALQRMGRNPPPVIITRREDALTMVRSAMLMAHVFPELGKEARDLSKTLGDLTDVTRRLRTERDELKSELARYNEQRVRLSALQEEKRQSEAEHKAELDSLRAAIASIAKNERELNALVAGVDKEVAKRNPPSSPEGGPTDSKTAAVLAPSGQRVAMLAPGRIKPQIPFAEAKAMLQLPIQGLRVASFGDKTRTGGVSKGIAIRTRFGGTVVSPCDGLVLYAAPFRAYGQLLIISPGGGYHILLAGLSQIDVQVGQSVLMGEPVGVMSSAVTSPAAEDSGPVLTVEFQKDRRPVDPDPWWSVASRKG